MLSPSLIQLAETLEKRLGLQLGDVFEIESDDEFANLVEIAAKNYAIGQRKADAEKESLREMQRRNLQVDWPMKEPGSDNENDGW